MGKRPLVGQYYSGQEWIPCTWMKNGQYREGILASLDIIDY